MSKKDPLTITEWLKILGEPNRLLLLDQIIEGVRCNCELGKSLSLSPNLVSHHLSILLDSDLINAKRDQIDARWIHYSVNIETMKQLKALLDGFFDENRIKPDLSTCGPRNLTH